MTNECKVEGGIRKYDKIIMYEQQIYHFLNSRFVVLSEVYSHQPWPNPLYP